MCSNFLTNPNISWQHNIHNICTKANISTTLADMSDLSLLWKLQKTLMHNTITKKTKVHYPGFKIHGLIHYHKKLATSNSEN